MQPLARIGANVTGIDPAQGLIDIAYSHACEDPSISNSITYVCGTVEEHADKHKEFYDAVVATEVLEHVVNKDLFLSACVSSLKVRRHSIIIIVVVFVVVVVMVIVMVIFLLFWGEGWRERGIQQK